MKKWIVVFLSVGLVGCGTTKPVTHQVDSELNRLSGLARSAYQSKHPAEAAKHYERALNRARAMDAFEDIGNSAYNLAVCEVELGRLDRARTHLQESRNALERAKADTVDTCLLEAKVAYLQGKNEEATQKVAEGFRLLGEREDDLTRIQLHLLKADAACERKDMADAREGLAAALTLTKNHHPFWLQADVARVRGGVALLESGWEEAAQEFEREIGLRKKGAQYPVMAEALVRAGDAYRLAGIFDKASDRYYRGARSMNALNNVSGALKVVERALEMARAAKIDKLERQAEALLDELR